jgi:flavorubredoxin
MITNPQSGTRIDEVATRIYRIHTPIALPVGHFNFNQYLIVDEQPLLFHTGPRQLFALVREAVDAVLPASSLRYIGFSHVEADESGSLNDWLAIAPQAEPVCSRIGALVSVADLANRAPRALEDGETLNLGTHTVRWIDTPHLPHGWDSGLLMDAHTRTLFCGDLFTQPEDGGRALTEGDILGPSEAFRQPLDYFAHAPQTGALLERLAGLEPATLACMHGSAWRGDGAGLLRDLAKTLART